MRGHPDRRRAEKDVPRQITDKGTNCSSHTMLKMKTGPQATGLTAKEWAQKPLPLSLDKELPLRASVRVCVGVCESRKSRKVVSKRPVSCGRKYEGGGESERQRQRLVSSHSSTKIQVNNVFIIVEA